VLVRFELTALKELGHLPSLEACSECGRAVAASGRVPFSQLAGGVLCDSCRVGQKQVISITAGVIKALARYAEEGDAWRRLELDARTYGELRGVLNHYWSHLLGHPLKMHRYLPLAP
jgi:recombinational DNA repair protein (RecF pathway)